MAIPFANSIDLLKNQLLNAVFQNLATAPASPKEGQFYYNTTDKKMFYYNGTAWVDTTYLLPIASATVLGGVKVGSGLAIAADGTLSATGTDTEIINNLTSDRTDAALAAAQGKVLKGLIDTLQTAINGLGTAATKNVGTASGNIPVLDSNGKLNTSVLPALAITEVFTVASQSAMTSLTAQQGDVAVRTDVNKTFILSKEPAATAANWIELQFPISVTSVNGKTGIITLTGEDINATVGSVTKSVQSFLADLGEIDLKVQENTTTITTIETQVNNITNTQGEAEGKNIHIDDSAEEPFVDISLHGESTQNGTPTPDNPSPIENVEGKNILDISKYADTSLWEKTTNYFMFTPVLKEDMPKFKKILSGSMKLKGTAQNLVFGLTTEKVTPAKELRILNNGILQNTSYDFKNADNIYLAIGNTHMISSDKYEIGLIFNNYDIQLEEGTVATPYVPYNSLELKATNGLEETDENYQEQVATFPLGEGEKLYQGSFLNDNGKNHTRGQYEFTGNETGWNYNSAQNAFWIRNSEITNCKNQAHSKLCNYFPYTSESFSVAPINTLCENSNSTMPMFIFKVSTDVANSLETWKTWLQNHNLIVEYDLAEPEIVPYTETQQEAWNRIKALMTYKNITNITSDAYAKVVYMRDNGLDVYETKQNAEKNYTKTTQKFAEQKITTDEISSKVSSLETTLENNYSTTEEMNSAITAKVNEIITELLPIKIITGVIPGSSYDDNSKTQTVVIDYPSGFNASNTIVIASMLEPVSTNYTSTFSGRVDVLLYSSGEYANKMEVSFREAWGLDMYYKIVLMKM